MMMTIWVYHGFGYAWTLEFIYKFVCSLKIKSRKEELHVCVYVCSVINWGNPFEEFSENKFEPL